MKKLKYAVLSDIHSNDVALEACMENIRKENPDGVLLLGDYVSDCPDPQSTLALLRKLIKEYPAVVLRGNREEYFIQYKEAPTEVWDCSSYKGSLLYTFERLKDEDIAWFKTLPDSVVFAPKGAEPITIAHGSPLSNRELLDIDRDNTKAALENLTTKWLICGHTHRQGVYLYKGHVVLNPGSLGVAIGDIKKAHMAYIEWDGAKWSYRFCAIPFDYERLKMKFEKSRLMQMAKLWPVCIMQSMLCGENVGPLCAKRAYDLSKADGVEITHHKVPEKYWEIAAREMGISVE
ncbi:MAG: metallophosphatase family protein [Lachnospiraceae bacterium]|nr:metallophosphatase family protein [Lachnospiraceae bacterium]